MVGYFHEKDERDVETEHGGASEAPADERAGNRPRLSGTSRFTIRGWLRTVVALANPRPIGYGQSCSERSAAYYVQPLGNHT